MQRFEMLVISRTNERCCLGLGVHHDHLSMLTVASFHDIHLSPTWTCRDIFSKLVGRKSYASFRGGKVQGQGR